MNDHNLDDLIINDIEPKNSKTKSFLTIIALLIVILIVAIILTKIILKDPNTQQIAFEENNTEMISPELTLQSLDKPKPKKEEPKLSNIIENTLKTPVPVPETPKKEKVVKKTEPVKETVEITKEVIEVPVQPEVKIETEDSVKEEEKLQQEYTEIRKERLAKEKAENKKAEQEEKAKAEIKKEIPKAVKPVPVKITEKAKQYPTIKPVKAPKTVPTETYYIQVGSFVKTPSSRFLGIIKKSGFNYKITPRASNGTKKLLIGPYKNRASANAALARVKDRINKSAFVVKK